MPTVNAATAKVTSDNRNVASRSMGGAQGIEPVEPSTAPSSRRRRCRRRGARVVETVPEHVVGGPNAIALGSSRSVFASTITVVRSVGNRTIFAFHPGNEPPWLWIGSPRCVRIDRPHP